MTLSKKMVAGIAGGAFLLGIAFGGNGSSTTAVATPTPAVTTTVIKTETKAEVPIDCIDALTYADRGFDLAGQGFDAAADGFRAVSDVDVKGLKIATERMTSTGNQIAELAPKYRQARDVCKQQPSGS